MDKKPQPKTGIARVWAAFFYSLDGLRSSMANEAAFRQELCVVTITSIALFFLPLPGIWKGLLFFATANVLVVELLNSAIESNVDLASPQYHELAKRAKDTGSAAVLLSVVIAIFLWVLAFLVHLY